MKAILLTKSLNTSEMKSLLSTLGIEVVKDYVQKKDPHPNSYFGPGKIEEMLDEVKTVDPDVIIVNDPLRPSQHHTLEMMFQKECIDRPGVILRIFAEHAHTPEAIAQVQLARLRYEQPFLREWIHKAKSGERPGFLAGGAYATDVYYEHAKSHMRRIEARLRDLSKTRAVKRTRRHEEGFVLVSLAGYTNAGKSALMNALCSSEVEVSSELFSSLSTTTRRVKGVRGKVLAIDTVGFLRDLPPDLIDAFNSTLEEVFSADLILLAFDASEDDDMIRVKIETSLNILQPRITNGELVLVGTKIDRISQKRIEEVVHHVRGLTGPYEVIMSSSLRDEGLAEIRERISAKQDRDHLFDVVMPLTDTSYSLLSRLHDIAEITHTVEDGQLRVQIQCGSSDAEKVRGWVLAAGAKLLRDGPTASNGNGGGPRLDP